MKDEFEFARSAGKRLFWHSALCAVTYAVAIVLTVSVALLTEATPSVLMLIAALGCAAASGYAWYLLRAYRVRCPQCDEDSAHFARDTQNRQLLICPQCGFRAPTGRKVLADSPVGH